MPHYQAKLSSKGQLTVPAPVREHFDLKTGDIVDFYVDKTERAVRMVARNKRLPVARWSRSHDPGDERGRRGPSGGEARKNQPRME